MAESLVDGVAALQRQTALDQAAQLKQEALDQKAASLGNTPISGESVEDKLARARAMGITEEEIFQTTRGKYGQPTGQPGTTPSTAPTGASAVDQNIQNLRQFQQELPTIPGVLPGTTEVTSQAFRDQLTTLDAPNGAAPAPTNAISDIADAPVDLNAGERVPVLPPRTNILDVRTPADLLGAVASGTIGVGNTIVDGFVGGTAEFVAGLDSDETKNILAKQRQGVELTQEEQAYTRTFDYLTQSASIGTAKDGREVVEEAFTKARDLVETDRLKQAKGDVTAGLAEAFDNEEFIAEFGPELLRNPLGTLGFIAESLPFMATAASKATGLPFAMAFTAENYKASSKIYEETFGDVPDDGEKALMLLGSAFIAAINSASAKFVTGEALVANMGTKLSQSALAKYLQSTATKLGSKLTADGSNKFATMLLNGAKISTTAAINLGSKGSTEFVEEGIEGLVLSAAAKQSLDFTQEEKRDAAVAGAIGAASGAGIGGTIDLARYTGEKLADRQTRILEQRDAERNGINFTRRLGLDLSGVDYVTSVEGTTIDTSDPNYDPLKAALEGPADVNNISSLRETVGHIKNAILVAQQIPADANSDESADYIQTAVEQGRLLADYNEQIQEIGNQQIEAALENPSIEAGKLKAAEVLKDVHFGSSATPINLNLVEQLKRQVAELSEQLGPVASSQINQAIAAAEKVQAAETKLTSTNVPTTRKGKTAAEVHDEIINGTYRPDGTRINKGGAYYRTALSVAIDTANEENFNRELEQLEAFIKNQQGKLPDNDPLRNGLDHVTGNREFLGGNVPVIRSEIEYLTAVRDEAVAAKKISETRGVTRTETPQGGVEVGRTTSPEGVAEQVRLPSLGQAEDPASSEEAPIGELPPAPDSLPVPALRGSSSESDIAVDAEEQVSEGDVANVSSAEFDIAASQEEDFQEPSEEELAGLFNEEDIAPKVAEDVGASESSDPDPDVVPAPATNPNLESSIPITKASNTDGLDQRTIAEQFASTDDLSKLIFLREGVFDSFDTFLATTKEFLPDLNLKFNSKSWKALKDIYNRAVAFQKPEAKRNVTLAQLNKKLTKSGKATDENPRVFGANYANNLALGLTVETSPGVFNFRPEVVAAISVATALWVQEDAYTTLNIDAHALSKWFGVDERDIDPFVAAQMREGGMARNLVAQNIGDRVYQTLGIKTTDDTAVGAKEKLSQALGLIAVEMMTARGELQVTTIGAKDLNDLFWGENRAKQPESGRRKTRDNATQVVRVRVASDINSETGFPQVHSYFYDPQKGNTAGVYKENKQLGPALFGIESEAKEALDEPKVSVTTTVRGGLTELTQEQQDAIRDAQNIEHYTNTSVASKLLSLGRPFMKELLGYIEDPETNSHVNNQEGHLGINLEIENTIDALIEHMVTKEEGGRGFADGETPFYFGISIAKNRRSYYESSKFNPQSKLLHRFTTKMRKDPKTVTTDVDSKDFVNFLVAITMGLELADEKAPLSEHIAKFKEYVNSPRMGLINKALKKNDGIALIKLMPEQSAHAFQATVELDKWYEASALRKAESFETDMTGETDGVTNGAAIGFVQFANAFRVADMWRWFERIGVYRQDSGHTGFQDWKSKGNNDSYQHMATKVATNLKNKLDFASEEEKASKTAVIGLIGPLADENGGVTPEARKLMKNPFMIHNYGASTSKILDAIADELIQKLIDGIEAAVQNNDQAALNKITKQIRAITGTNDVIEPLRVDTANDLDFNKNNLWNMLRFSILETITDPVTDALNDELGDFTNIRATMNDAFQIQFVQFDEAYQAELAKLKAASPNKILSEGQAREALKAVQWALPGFSGAMENTKPENRIPVIKTRTTLSEDDQNDIVKIYLTQANSVGAKSASGKAARKIFVDGGVSGAILAIHSLDSTIQQRAMKIMRVRHGVNMLNIWDAGLTDIEASQQYAEIYNGVFVETMRDYNMLRDIQAMMGPTRPSKAIDARLKEMKHKVNGKFVPKYLNLTDFNNQLEAAAVANELRKNQVFGEDLYIEQMVHPASESQHNYSGDTVAKPITFTSPTRPEGFNNVASPNNQRNNTSTQTRTEETVQPVQRATEEPVQVVPRDPLAPVANLKAYLKQRLSKYPQEVQDMVDEIEVVAHDSPDWSPTGVGRFVVNPDGTTKIQISDALNRETDTLNREDKPWFRLDGTRTKLLAKIFHHEVGHAIDYALRKKHGERPSDAYKNIVVRNEERNRAKNAPELSKTRVYMSYAFENIADTEIETQGREWFAEIYSWFITDRASMIAEQPDLAEWMDTIYATIFRETLTEPTPTNEEGQPLRGPASPEVLNTKAGQKQAEVARAEYSEEVEPSTVAKGTIVNLAISSNAVPITTEVRQSFKLYGQTYIIHKPNDGTKGWFVSEIITGRRVSRIAGSTQAKAQEEAIKRIRDAGPERMNGIIAKEQTMNEEYVSVDSPFPSKGSSDRQIDIDTFVADSTQNVTSNNLMTVFNALRGLGAPSNLNPDYLQHLQTLLGTVIRDGIAPLDNLILKIKSDQSGSFGQITGSTIYMNTNSNRKTYTEQSAEEVLVHELIHAISAAFIDGNTVGRAKIRRLYEIARKSVTYKDFLKTDANGNIIYTVSEEAEIAEAKRLYNYVFNTRSSTSGRGRITNNALHEFFTFAMTNEQLITKLSSIPTRETKFTKEGSLFDSFLSVMEDIFNFIAKTLDTTDANNIQSELSNILHNVVAVEQSNIFSVLNAIERGFAAGRKPLDLSVQYLVDQLASMITAVVPRAGREAILGFIPNTLKAVANTVLYHQNMEGIASDNPVTAAVKDASGALVNSFTAEEGVLRKTMNSLINRSAEFADWHKMLRNSKHLVDQLRSTVASTIAINVRDRFSQKLTQLESKSITRAFLQADLAALRGYSMDRIAELLKSRPILNAEIQSKRKDLLRGVPQDQRAAVTRQARGLASMMIHGSTTVYNQALNVHHILSPMGLVELAPALDELITLYAMAELPGSGSSLAASVIEREQASDSLDNGVTHLIAQHRAFKSESLARLFNDNPMLMNKGYMAEIYDQQRDLKIAPVADRLMLENEGYTFLTVVKDDETSQAREPKALYMAKNSPQIQRLKSIVSVKDKAAKGTTLADSARSEGQGFNRVLDSLQISRTKHIYNSKEQGVGVSPENVLIPLRNENGEIVNYRYQMSEANRSKYLKKDYDIGTVMGAMHASIESKANSEQINNEAVRMAHADWIDNKDEQAEKFIAITNDPRSPHFETYKLMPKAMRLEVDRVFGKGNAMMIRAELSDLIFGFKKASLANISFIKGSQFANVVGLIERGWQEIVAQEKVNIVIKSIDVMLNNIISNTIILKVLGVPMADIFRDTKEAVDGMNRYQKDFEELLALEKELAGDPRKANSQKFVSRVEFLKNELKVNPVAELVDEGIFQSITEDIDADQYGDKTKLLDWLQNTVGKHTPDFVKSGIEYAYISENTQAFKFLMKTTQYSDFTARYVMFKHEMAKEGANKDAVLTDIIRTFINYDDPSNKYTQWGNDMGLIMFTKFTIGIQNVILRIAGKKTANLATSLLAQQYVMDVSDVTDSFLLTGGVTHMFHLNPITHIENAFAPWGIVTATAFLS